MSFEDKMRDVISSMDREQLEDIKELVEGLIDDIDEQIKKEGGQSDEGYEFLRDNKE